MPFELVETVEGEGDAEREGVDDRFDLVVSFASSFASSSFNFGFFASGAGVGASVVEDSSIGMTCGDSSLFRFFSLVAAFVTCSVESVAWTVIFFWGSGAEEVVGDGLVVAGCGTV